MVIKQTIRAGNAYGDLERLTIEVNGRDRVSVGGGEPEDNCLGRDLSFAFDIVPLLFEAYEAGKNGEKFELTKCG